MLIASCFLLGACAELPAARFPFAAAVQPSDTDQPTEVRMTGAEITLAAPRGYCFDEKFLRRDAADGFALLPRCDRLNGGGFFPSFGSSAIITATLGKASGQNITPSTTELAASVPGAHVLEQREDDLLPLVKLDMPGHGARGASSEHWRGAFVEDGHVILLALYAPENSPMLDSRGAVLLDQMARLTHAASAPAEATPAPLAEPANPHAEPRRTASGALRPQARPAPEGATNVRREQKLPLLQRIAGLFD